MNRNEQTYQDRFGNEWSVKLESKAGKPACVSFTCSEFRLVAVDGETENQTELTPTRLKELFCDAERVVVHGKEKWYVGFRQRIGRGGRPQGGLHIRFRSESGEVRYAKEMLHFRHMPDATLCEYLAAAMPTASPPPSAPEAT